MNLRIPTLLEQGVSRDDIGKLLRDTWQMQFDNYLLTVSYNAVTNPAINLDAELEQIQLFINNYRAIWPQYVREYDLPETYARTYSGMEAIFDMNIEDMEELYDPVAKLPFYIHVQGKHIASEYNFNCSMLQVKSYTMTRDEVREQYRKIVCDFDGKVNQIKELRGRYFNQFTDSYKQLLMRLDELYEETLADTEDFV